MPVTETVVLQISCDNPACPGNELDETSRVGWTFVSTEVYGAPTNPQGVYCCAECAGAITLVLNPPVELPPPEPG
jgi:hypothetical protein